MPEDEKPSLLEALTRSLIQRVLGGLGRYAEQLLRRLLRLVGLYLAGFMLAVVGLVFLALGVVRWLTLLIPSWLAWLIVGIVLFLLGVVLTMAAYIASRS